MVRAAPPATPEVRSRLSCATPTFCARLTTLVEVGILVPPKARNVVELWNGNSWSTAPSPLPTRPDPAGGNPVDTGWLYDIDCPTPGSCIAAGAALPSSTSLPGANGAIVARWNGALWTNQTTRRGQRIASLSCAAVDRCLGLDTVGNSYQPSVRALDGPRPG